MTGTHSFAWTGVSGAAWNSAADWWDEIFATVAAVAPGSLDGVSITGGLLPLVVTGSGAAASVATYRSVLLDGSFQFGTVNVEGTLTLAGSGARLSAAGLGEAGAAGVSAIVVAGTSLTVSGGTVAGGVAVSGGGWARLGLQAAVSAGVSVDANSCVEVGTGGNFWPGWLKVYSDGTLSGTGAIAANTVVTGTILSSGLRFGGLLGGNGQVRLDSSGATVGIVFQGAQLVFAAPGAVLTMTQPQQMGGTLVGFGAGDAIDLPGVSGITARYAPIDAQDGELQILGAGGGFLEQFAVAGPAASYAATAFMTAADGSGGTMVLAVTPASFGPAGAGSIKPQRDIWTGVSGAAWNSAADWWDEIFATVAAVAPGSLDGVSITGGLSPLVVTGSGAAASVATYRSVLLDGSFQFGTVNVEGTLTLAGSGARLSAAGLGEAGAAVASAIVVAGTSLTVSGGTVAGGVAVSGGGWARLGLQAAVSAGVSVDANSCVEVGTGGNFWPGWLKVYSDGTLSGTGAIAANTVVTGTILSSGLRFGGLLGGNGQVRLDSSGATVGIVFQGAQLVFAAPGAVLTVTQPQQMGGTLVGFGAGDAIDLPGVSGITARYAPIDAQDGELQILGAGGGFLEQFAVAGSAASYAATAFMTAADGSGGTMVVAVTPANGAAVSAGNATPHRDSWTGASGATWNAASNWWDQTLAAAAVVAPGSLDSVSITGGLSPLVVTGSGAAASVATYRSVLLDGWFQFGTVNVEGTLTLAGSGARLSAAGLGEAGAAGVSAIVVAGTSLTVSGGTVAGGVAVSGGGWARLGLQAAVSAGVSVDANSCVEVGTGGNFWPGWLKVYSDGTLSGTGAIAANTVVTGTILSSGLRFGGLLGGNGQVRLDSSGATVGIVFQGAQLVFAAPGAVLTVTQPQQMGGTLVGFGAGDAIDLPGVSGTTARYAPIDAQDGELQILGAGGGFLEQFAVAGPAAFYGAGAFNPLPDGAGGSLVLFTHPS